MGALSYAGDVQEVAVLEGAGDEGVEFLGGGDGGHFDYVERGPLSMILNFLFLISLLRKTSRQPCSPPFPSSTRRSCRGS